MEFKILAALLLVKPGSENMALNMWFTSTAFQYSAHPYVPATLNYYYQQR